ncbi:MAG: hypothetical protein ACLQO1_02645 [Steroidobacteraceae bacterium]
MGNQAFLCGEFDVANWSSDTFYIQVVEPMDANDLMTSIKLEKPTGAYWGLTEVRLERGCVVVHGNGWWGTSCTFTEDTWKIVLRGIVAHQFHDGCDDDVHLDILIRGEKVHTQKVKIYDTKGWKPFVGGTDLDKHYLKTFFTILNDKLNERQNENAWKSCIPQEIKDKALTDYLAEREADIQQFAKSDIQQIRKNHFINATPEQKAERLKQLRPMFKSQFALSPEERAARNRRIAAGEHFDPIGTAESVLREIRRRNPTTKSPTDFAPVRDSLEKLLYEARFEELSHQAKLDFLKAQDILVESATVETVSERDMRKELHSMMEWEDECVAEEDAKEEHDLHG